MRELKPGAERLSHPCASGTRSPLDGLADAGGPTDVDTCQNASKSTNSGPSKKTARQLFWCHVAMRYEVFGNCRSYTVPALAAAASLKHASETQSSGSNHTPQPPSPYPTRGIALILPGAAVVWAEGHFVGVRTCPHSLLVTRPAAPSGPGRWVYVRGHTGRELLDTSRPPPLLSPESRPATQGGQSWGEN